MEAHLLIPPSSRQIVWRHAHPPPTVRLTNHPCREGAVAHLARHIALPHPCPQPPRSERGLDCVNLTKLCAANLRSSLGHAIAATDL